MKRLLGIAVATMIAVPAWATIVGSEHDFTAGGAASGKAVNQTTDMCGSCHVPHAPLINVPLWIHALGTGDPFQLYSDNTGYTGGNAASYDNTVMGTSEACLSCHDGTVAVIGAITLTTADRWILYDSDNGGAVSGANTNLGLKGSHPVMVDYSAFDGTGDFELISAIDARLKIEGGYVQCGTCHNAHDEQGLGVGTGMLNMANTNSAMCRECHNK